MQWEWRIFFLKERFELWKRLISENKNVKHLLKEVSEDKRPDYYFNLKNSQYGLKERWVVKDQLEQAKLELKILLEKENGDGPERWEKIISKRLMDSITRKDGLSIKLIQDLLIKEMEEINKDYQNNLLKVIRLLDTEDLERILIKKSRKQLRGINTKNNLWVFYQGNDRQNAPLEKNNVVLIEQSNIRISKIDEKPKNVLTLCIEGSNPEIINKFKDQFIETKFGLIMSYPQYITNAININDKEKS